MRSSLHIPKIEEKLFWRRLRQHVLENPNLIKHIEAYFKTKRGYVLKMPRPNTPVILLVSGGLDSSVILGALLSSYKLRVYPLFLDSSGQTARSQHSLSQIYSFFYKKYGEILEPLMKFTISPYPQELEEILRNKTSYHPNFLFDVIHPETKKILDESVYCPHRIIPYTSMFYCLKYARYLYAYKGIKIHTFFSSILPTDGIVLPAQTFTSLRTAMLSMCSITNSFDLQYTSLPFEKEFGTWLEKQDLIKIGTAMGMPLEKTWSCYKDHTYHCGTCLACQARKNAFCVSGIKDNTIYEDNQWHHRTIHKTKILFKQIFPSTYQKIKSIKKT